MPINILDEIPHFELILILMPGWRVSCHEAKYVEKPVALSVDDVVGLVIGTGRIVCRMNYQYLENLNR